MASGAQAQTTPQPPYAARAFNPAHGDLARSAGVPARLANEAYVEALARIVSIVESTADQVRSIATASEQQSAASEQINRGTDEVNRIASEMAEAMAQSTREVGELARLSSELQDVIRELKEDS